MARVAVPRTPPPVALLLLALSTACTSSAVDPPCSQVPGCIVVETGDVPPAPSGATAQDVRVNCPESHPYLWNVTVEDDQGATGSLVRVFGPQDASGEVPGGVVELAARASGAPLDVENVKCGCSDTQMTLEALGVPVEDDSYPDTPQSLLPWNPPSAYTGIGDTGTNYLGEAIWTELTTRSDPRGRLLGITYARSERNTLQDGWILQTPDRSLWGSDVNNEYVYFGTPACQRNCDPEFDLERCSSDADCAAYAPRRCRPVSASVKAPGDAPVKMCVRAQDVLWDRVYEIVAGSEQLVDVTTLYSPTGRFKTAIKNAITYLAASGRQTTVRVLWGFISIFGKPSKQTPTEFAQDVVAGAQSGPGARVRVQVASQMTGLLSWNHSKIVAADGRIAIAGGENLWDEDYLGVDPVTDMSMQLRGPASYDAQRFAHRLWERQCDPSNPWPSTVSWDASTGIQAAGCKWTGFPIARPEGTGDTAVFSVGRLANGIEADANQADDALLALMTRAKKAVRITQQSILFPNYIPLPYIPWTRAVAGKVLEGVDVYFVISNPKGKGGEGANDYDAVGGARTAAKVIGRFARLQSSLSDAQLKDLLCSKLHVTSLRVNQSDQTWKDRGTFALHAKTYIGDDMAFYVGSENFYPSALQEFGFIVPDQARTQAFLDGWWNQIWKYSRRRAVTGSDMPPDRPCVFRE